MHTRTLRFLLPALLVLATLIAYWPAIRYAGFIWDDDVHLTKNPVIFAADGLLAIWSKTTWRVQFYPMTFTTFWLQYRMSGLEPLAYHLVNVLFHTANALLLWQLLRRLGLCSAFWVAAVFALHPVNVESVAWVAERKNVLMGFFILLSALAYWRFEGRFENPPAARDWRFYALAAAAYVAALFSKTVCCSFPAALAIILWWKRGKLTFRDMLPLFPWLLFGLGIGWWTAHLEKGGRWKRRTGLELLPLRAHPYRGPLCVVLRREIPVAGEPELQLSALEYSRSDSCNLRRTASRRRGNRRALAHADALGPRAICGGGNFPGDYFSRSGLCRLLHNDLQPRCGSLCLSRDDRADSASARAHLSHPWDAHSASVFPSPL